MELTEQAREVIEAIKSGDRAWSAPAKLIALIRAVQEREGGEAGGTDPWSDLIADPSGLTILDSVDLRQGPMPRVFDQGQLG